MEIHYDSSKLKIGNRAMSSLLQGGLTLGRFSYWTGGIHNFSTGTLLNLIISAAANNRPPEGTEYLASFISSELNPTAMIGWMARALQNYPTAPKQLVDEEDHEYVRRAFARWGWAMSIGEYVSLDMQQMLYRSERMATPSRKLRLICVDGMERFIPRFMKTADYVGSLVAGLPDDCHLAVGRLLGSHNTWLRRMIDEDTKYLRILSRTGYVPKFPAELTPEHAIVHGVLKNVAGHPPASPDGQMFVGYHAANDYFDRGFANVRIDGNAWSHPTDPDECAG